MVGPLGHILKNRCYVGEVVYRGEVHRGEHEPILDRELFDAVQARLREGAVRWKGAQPSSTSPSLLTGLLFDDRGNRMTPSHAKKKGVRYRYYVSQAVLQNRKASAGAITRVSAPDVEERVLSAVRNRMQAGQTEPCDLTDRGLLAVHVTRIVLCAERIEVTLRSADGVQEELDAPKAPSSSRDPDASVLIIPWIRAVTGTRKGFASEPTGQRCLDPRTREALLLAVAKARRWVEDLVEGRVASFEEIARHEGKVERHVRLLAPLAFLSPKIIAAIIDDSMPADLTVTALARALPHSWAEQEHALGMS